MLNQNIDFRPVLQSKPADDGYPKIRDLFAIVYIALTTLIMTYSTVFGFVPILVFYAIWFPHIRYKGILVIRPSKDIYPIMVLGAFCVLSALWSDYRVNTAKASLEFVSTLLCTVIIARTVTVEAFVKGLIVGLFLVLLVPFRSGHYDMTLFGSKNQVGVLAEFGLFVTILYVCSKGNKLFKLLFCAAPLILFSASLVFAKSGTSVASLAATFCISCVGYSLAKFPPRFRMPLLVTTIVFMVLFLVGGFYFGLQDVGLNALGKDSSLTGRTFLWSQGINFTLQQHPLTGVGYQAFWVVGRPLAEALWFKFDVFARAGFHFHNMVVNTFVELGPVGVLIIAYIYLKTCVESLKFLVKHGARVDTILMVGFAVMFLTRSMAEIDTFGPFGTGTIFFYSIIPRIAAWREQKKQKPVSAPLGLPQKQR